MEKNIIAAIRAKLEEKKGRSAWERGVINYAWDLVDGLEESINGGWFDVENIASPKLLEKCLLNGAESWNQYSWGGSSLIYDYDIAERLCTPSELKRTKYGERRPNSREEWLDTQARALFQASRRVMRLARECVEG